MTWLIGFGAGALCAYGIGWFIYQLGTYLHIRRVGVVTDCRDPDCERERGCMLVRYVGPSPNKPGNVVDLKLHGNGLDVLKAWRNAAAKGIVPGLGEDPQ